MKLVWGASRVIRANWRLGLFGFYDRTERRHDGLAISLRGLLLWSLALLAAAYVAAMSGIFWIWSRNSYSVLTYADALLYPVRRAEISEKKGRAFIAEGQDLFRAQKWHEAARYLTLGLARCRDSRARLTLAQYYVLSNQRAVALRVLREGLTDEYPGRSYLEALFGAAEQGEDFAVVSEAAARYRQATGIPEKDRRWLDERGFAALLSAGRAADALAYAEKENSSDAASEHRVLALLALGRAPEAERFLGEWRVRPGAEPGVPLRLLVRARREAGRFEEMETALKELRELTPAEPAPRVYAVVQEAIAGRDAAAQAALDDYLFRFGGKSENLLLLATPLGEIRARALLQRVTDAAAERGYPLLRFQKLLAQAHAQAGDFAAAARVLSAMPDTAQLAPIDRVWRGWLEALVEAARTPGETAQTTLGALLRDRPWPLGFFRLSAEILIRAERWETARDALAIGRRAFPASASLEAQTKTVETALAARATQTAATEASRARPSPASKDSERPEDVLEQIRTRAAQAEIPAMMTAVRVYLNGERVRTERVLAVAKELFDAGNQEPAVALAKEVLRRMPGFPPAQRLLKQIEPAPEKN